MADLPSLIDLSSIPDYERGAQDLTIRNRLFLAMLQKRGRITYNHSGTKCVWDAIISHPQATGWIGQSLEFGSHNPLIQFESDWRGLINTDAMDIMTFMKNKGDKTQLVNVLRTKIDGVMTGLRNSFTGELFNDGSDDMKPLGLRSFLGAGTVVVTDKVAAPSDTYAGRSTVVGSQGGSWETTAAITAPNASIGNNWPWPRGTPEYDCTSPKLVNVVSTAWTATNTWLANAWRVLNTTRNWLKVDGDKEHMPDIALLSADYYDGWQQCAETKSHIILPHRESSDLGFGDVMNMEGMAVQGADFDVPASQGFVMNLNTVEIKCMFDVLFKVLIKGVSTSSVDAWLNSHGINLDDLSNRFACGFLGNVTYMPKFVAHLYPHAAS